jgi:chromosome segregation ATPase
LHVAQNLISEREALAIRLKEATAEIERRATSEDALKLQLSRSEASLREAAGRSEEGAATREQERVKFEERVLYLQMQINAMRSKEEAKEKEFAALQALSDKQAAELRNLQNVAQDHAINAGDYKEVIRECHNRIQSLESELERTKEKESELLRNNAHGSVLKAEQESILSNLRRELKSALLAKDEYAQMCAQLEEYRTKAEAKLAKMSDIVRAVDEAREALEEKESRIALLQSEAQVAERNHAVRTAMLATVEAHVASLKAELKEKDESLTSAKKDLLDVQVRLDEENRNHALSQLALQTDIEKLRQTLESEKLNHKNEVESIQAHHAESLETLKRDHAKKSAAARSLLAERDEEVRVLASRAAELQDEITSGAHNERRIFELAQQQSRREATHNIHRSVELLDELVLSIY